MKDLDKVYAERIAEEYAPKKERKVAQLHKLDRKVKNPPFIFAITFGIVSSLFLGIGMSFIMTDFGPSGNLGLILGIIIGVIGLALCLINYPIYVSFLKSRKQKYAFEITELAKEISEEE